MCYSNEAFGISTMGSMGFATQIYGKDAEYEKEISMRRSCRTMDFGNFNSFRSVTEVSQGLARGI